MDQELLKGLNALGIQENDGEVLKNLFLLQDYQGDDLVSCRLDFLRWFVTCIKCKTLKHLKFKTVQDRCLQDLKATFYKKKLVPKSEQQYAKNINLLVLEKCSWICLDRECVPI